MDRDRFELTIYEYIKIMQRRSRYDDRKYLSYGLITIEFYKTGFKCIPTNSLTKRDNDIFSRIKSEVCGEQIF